MSIFNKIYRYSELDEVLKNELVTRNSDPENNISAVVENIIADVRLRGDQALIEYAKRFDNVALESVTLDRTEIERIAADIDTGAKEAIDSAYANIYKFHITQTLNEQQVETMPGVTCWRESRAIERVGLYIPGGSAVLPSTFLMLGIPARIAGCKEIIVCSPPSGDGKVNPYIAYVASLLDIDKIYLSGGAQAIAAMAFGTESMNRADKIFGPGNQFVTRAKTIVQLSSRVSIDMPAGPSEVLIIADRDADPVFVAADLLAQAEHGADSQAILVSDSQEMIDGVLSELKSQLELLPRKDLAAKALAQSYAVLTEDMEEAMEFSNFYAPEHLILATSNWESLSHLVVNAGSVFLGTLSPESAGDYASGTNHTLPTSAYARSYSGVSLDSFVKKITFQHLNEEGVRSISSVVEKLAEIEGLQAHKLAMSLRREKVNKGL